MNAEEVLKTKYTPAKSKKIMARLDKDSKSQPNPERYIYEKIGQLMISESATKVMKDSKSTGFDASYYNDIREKQKFVSIEDRYDVTEGVYTCKRPGCDSKKHFVFLVQERSRDEPETTYVVCAVCSNQFKISS